jgi:hypothetical protein
MQLLVNLENNQINKYHYHQHLQLSLVLQIQHRKNHHLHLFHYLVKMELLHLADLLL